MRAANYSKLVAFVREHLLDLPRWREVGGGREREENMRENERGRERVPFNLPPSPFISLSLSLSLWRVLRVIRQQDLRASVSKNRE
jgi:hypothetical protein